MTMPTQFFFLSPFCFAHEKSSDLNNKKKRDEREACVLLEKN